MSKPEAYAIKVKNISKSYGDVKALDDVSFDVKKGEIFGLLGPNGAGKTTLLSIIECLRDQDSGSIFVLGLDTQEHATQIQRRIGVQLQSTSLIPDLKVIDQMELYSKLYGKKRSRDELLQLLAEVGLTKKANTLPRKLSGGQKQRLALAIAIINDPDILFLDEPTVGLDAQSRHKLWDIILDLHKKGRTIILTTHYIEEAENLCQQVGIIDHGHLIAMGSPKELVSQLTEESIVTLLSDQSLQELHSLSEDISTQYQRNSINIKTSDVLNTLRTLLELVDEHDISVDELLIKNPNLEDYFLKMTGRSLRS